MDATADDRNAFFIDSAFVQVIARLFFRSKGYIAYPTCPKVPIPLAVYNRKTLTNVSFLLLTCQL